MIRNLIRQLCTFLYLLSIQLTNKEINTEYKIQRIVHFELDFKTFLLNLMNIGDLNVSHFGISIE
jgi:hypothetical protein